MLRKTQSEIRIKEKKGSPEKREDGYEALEKAPMMPLIIIGATVMKKPTASLRCLLQREKNCSKCLVDLFHPS